MDTSDHDPRDYRPRYRHPEDKEFDKRIAKLERDVKSLYEMIKRRDKKIAKLQKIVR